MHKLLKFCMSTFNNPLLDFINCEVLDLNLFRGQSLDLKTGQVYGGQVLGQAIEAAYATLTEDRKIHSAHAYFLLRGDVNAPIIYDVERCLDGGSFSSRRVVAIQHGRQIFHMSASFQKPEEGLDFSQQCEPPVDVLNTLIEQSASQPVNFQRDFFDVHMLSQEQSTHENSTQFWMKAKHPLSDDEASHHAVLGYISDMGLLRSCLTPTKLDQAKLDANNQRLIMATIDHAIWFHRPFRADEWLFYDCRVESNGNGRGKANGSIYDINGTLIASTSQEGLIRLRPAKK